MARKNPCPTAPKGVCDDDLCPGWAWFNDREIQRCDTCKRFGDDDDAVVHVRACAGCQRRLKRDGGSLPVPCSCRGLGASISWNGSTSDPQLEPVACEAHPLDAPTDKERFEALTARLEECLAALADVRDIIWPADDPDHDCGADEIGEIANRLDFLNPQRKDV